MAYLAFNLNDGNEFVFDLLEDRLTLGRDVGNDIVIDNTYISGHHAEFLMQPDGMYELVDLKSSNGTYVNGKRIDRAKVKGGDRLRFGQLAARFRERAPRGLAPDQDGSKTVSVSAGTGTGRPSREDGRRGDTESIPLRDAAARVETGKVEPTIRTSVSREPLTFATGLGAEAVVSQELERLRREVEELESRRDAVRKEGAAEVEAAKKDLEGARADLVRTKAEMERLQAELKQTKAESEKAVSVQREVANLESKKESMLRELEKIQKDVERAQGSLKTVHDEVEQSRAKAKEERQAVERKREELTREEEETREALERVRSEMQQAEQTLEAMKKLERNASESTAQVAKLTEDEQAVRRKLDASRGELSEIENAVNAEQQKLMAARSALSALVLDEVAVKSALAEVLAKRDEAAEGLKKVEEEKGSRESELTAVKSELAWLGERKGKAEVTVKALEEDQLLKQQKVAEEEQRLNQLASHIREAEKRAGELAVEEARLAKEKVALTELLAKRDEAEVGLKKVQSEKASWESEIKAAEKALASVQEKIALEENKAVALESSVTARQGVLAQLEQRRVEVDEALTALLLKRTEEENQVAGWEARVWVAREAVDQLEADLTAKGSELKAAELSLKSVQERLATSSEEVAAKLEAEGGRLLELAAGAAEKSAELAALENALKEKSAAYSALEAKGEELQKLQERETALRSDVDELVASKNKIETELEVARERGRAQNTLNVALTARTEAAEKVCGEVEKSRDELKSDVVELEGKKGDLEKVISETHQAHEKLKSEVAEAVKTLAVLDEQRGALQTKAAKLIDEVSTKQAMLGEIRDHLAEAERHAQVVAGHEAEQAARFESLKSEIGALEVLLAGVMASKATAEGELQQCVFQKESTASEVKTLQNEVVSLTARLDLLKSEVAELETLKKDKGQLSVEAEALNAALMALRAEEATVRESLAQQKEEQKALGGRKAELEQAVAALGEEVQTLQTRQNELLAKTQEMEAARDKVGEESQSLAAEVTQLTREAEKLREAALQDTAEQAAAVSVLESKRMAVLAEVVQAEKRLEGLNEVQRRLDAAIAALQEVEAQRLEEERQLADLTRRLDESRSEMDLTAKRVVEQSALAEAAVGRVNEAEAAAAKVVREAEASERRLMETSNILKDREAAIQLAAERGEALKEEEVLLQGRLPTLKSEVAGLEATLSELMENIDRQTQAERLMGEQLNEKEQRLRMMDEELRQVAEQKKAAAVLAQEIVDLADKREQLEKASDMAVEESVRAKAFLEEARAEKRRLEEDLPELREAVAALRAEEKLLSGQVGTQRNDLHAAGVALEALRQKQALIQAQVSEFSQSGGELISVGEALLVMKAQKLETQKTIKAAAEKELELQVRLGVLQEALNRESTRVEQVAKERAQVEGEFQRFMKLAQTDAQKLREEHAALLKSVEELKGKSAALEEDKPQMKQWEQIEKRLRSQLEELEEKHEVMRIGLAVDESTVLMFAKDLIKRLDLIDSLRKRYADATTGDVADQLYTLRASIEDVLLQHGIVEFEVEPGTVVDVDLRKRITVVDAVAGNDRPRVVETFRSGFLRVMDDGQERILRKVEVRTSCLGE